MISYRSRRAWLSLLGALPFLSIVFCLGLAAGVVFTGWFLNDYAESHHVVFCEVD